MHKNKRRVMTMGRTLGGVLVLLIGVSLSWNWPQRVHAESTSLAAGQTLAPGAKIVSPDGQYVLSMQTDGNLVQYNWPRPLWASNTANHSGTDLEMQTDGNLVLYTPGHVAIWASNTAGHPGAYVQLQNDANLVMLAANGSVIWATGATDTRLDGGQLLNPGWQFQSPDRRYRMVMQTDGNLVVYDGNTPLWASNTQTANSVAQMQADGNLVVYAPGHLAVWASNTAGKNNSAILGQNDGNFVIYAPGNVTVWSTKTAQSGTTNTTDGTLNSCPLSARAWPAPAWRCYKSA